MSDEKTTVTPEMASLYNTKMREALVLAQKIGTPLVDQSLTTTVIALLILATTAVRGIYGSSPDEERKGLEWLKDGVDLVAAVMREMEKKAGCGSPHDFATDKCSLSDPYAPPKGGM